MTAETFRKAIAVFVLVVAIGGVYCAYVTTGPCTHPITYHLGMVDSRFGESRANLLKATQLAVDIWSVAEGKTLFVYDPKGAITVNLIFDNRQATVNLGTAIAETESDYEAQRAAIQALEARYASDLAIYNQKVEYWNSHGGAPAATFKELQTQKANLTLEIDTINNKIAVLNAEARQTNQSIDTYNQSAGQFEEGEYVRENSGQRIDVYEFTSTTQLVRLLAHEFGHALGLDHNQNPASIMYPVNKGRNLTLSAEDKAALEAICSRWP